MSRSGYQPLNRDDESDNDIEESQLLPSPVLQRKRSKPNIDLRKLDYAFKKWTENIAQKMKAMGKRKEEQHNERIEIARSVFSPEVPYPTTTAFAQVTKSLDHKGRMTHGEYQGIVRDVQAAIAEGYHPKMISKGSSGSYFVRSKGPDGKYQIVGVFKPKDEEPYGRLNPKTTKWLHRKLRWVIPFGRACLIPNLSYLSEAAASLMDERLDFNIVPRTELVSLSSSSFFYDWIDRSAAKKGKPLPDKIGSMQCFMNGYQDASEFLRLHPLPDRSIADTYDDSTHRTTNLSKRFSNAIQVICGRTGDQSNDDGYDPEDGEDDQGMYEDSVAEPDDMFHWTPLYLQEFREELEKLVLLDYLMRNTDRGSDNYMIKTCNGLQEKNLVDIAPSAMLQPQMRIGSDSATKFTTASPPPPSPISYQRHAHVHIAAIDNSLSFPHEHPRGWRSYTYGWLFLPVSVIGRPFSDATRKKMLPLLTSKTWWEETTFELRKMFALDPGFHPSMFRRQLAVIKGQAWNIVQCLMHSDEGPLELTRRSKVLVWDDEIEISENELEAGFNGPLTSSPLVHGSELPGPPTNTRRFRRSQSIALPSEFPPPMQRRSTDVAGLPRPVSFASKFPRINPGASGVSVLEHMERLDVVEAGLKRLGEDAVIDGEEGGDLSTDALPLSSVSPSKRTLVEPSITAPIAEEVEEEGDEDDITAQGSGNLAKSLPQLNEPALHTRWATAEPDRSGPARQSLDLWTPEQESVRKKKVIIERLEPVQEKSWFSC